MKKCKVCGRIGERHHIKSRGAGGGDEDKNILILCRNHHQEIHMIGKKTFAKKYGLEQEIADAYN